jgi:hypothetical protein
MSKKEDGRATDAGPKFVHAEGKTFDGLSWLTADSLGDLDHGFARVTINEAIKEVANDLEQRGDDEKPRKVVITLTMTQLNENDTEVQFNVEAKVPPMKLATTIAQKRPVGQGNSGIAFRPENPTRPDQPTLNFPPAAQADGGEEE